MIAIGAFFLHADIKSPFFCLFFNKQRHQLAVQFAKSASKRIIKRTHRTFLAPVSDLDRLPSGRAAQVRPVNEMRPFIRHSAFGPP
jgi:hypothetical protein